jgi:AcrR family transcriptional regulator
MRKNKELFEQLFKQEVVETVLELIKLGEAVTMEEVARRCSVAKGSLYNHFRNKEELLDHVHQVVLDPLLKSNQEIFESERDPRIRLDEFIDSVFASHEKISTYFYFIWQNKTAEEVFSERVRVLIHPLAKICQQGITSGSFVKVDPYVLAEMIYGTVIGPLTSLNYRQNVIQDKEKMKQDVKTLINKIIC